jgi:methylglyoxal synthase
MKIALIVHDGKKADMVDFVMKRLVFFTNKKVEIVATGTTGGVIKRAGDSTGEMSCLYMEPTQFKEIDTIIVKRRINGKKN